MAELSPEEARVLHELTRIAHLLRSLNETVAGVVALTAPDGRLRRAQQQVHHRPHHTSSLHEEEEEEEVKEQEEREAQEEEQDGT